MRPFANKEEFIDAFYTHSKMFLVDIKLNTLYTVLCVNDKSVLLSGNNTVYYNNMYKFFNFEDGTLCAMEA